MTGGQERRFFGKYRGTVKNNLDPERLGRVQVSVPAVQGTGDQAWAMPCVPYAGPGVGLFAVPPRGASVWVEYEGGDPNRPILAGCFWEALGPPPGPADPLQKPFTKVFKADGIDVTASEVPGKGGLTIEVTPPAVLVPLKLVLDQSGIELSVGVAKIKLTPQGVSVNDGALEVT